MKISTLSDILCFLMAVFCLIGAATHIGNPSGISMALSALAVILGQIPSIKKRLE